MKSKTITIGDSEFVVHTIPPFSALAILGNLQRELSPVLGSLASLKEGDAAEFDKVLEVIAPRLDGDALLKWTEVLLKPDYVSFAINGNMASLSKDNKELAFADPMQIIEVMFELLRFNFEGPLKSFASRFGLQLQALTKAKT